MKGQGIAEDAMVSCTIPTGADSMTSFRDDNGAEVDVKPPISRSGIRLKPKMRRLCVEGDVYEQRPLGRIAPSAADEGGGGGAGGLGDDEDVEDGGESLQSEGVDGRHRGRSEIV